MMVANGHARTAVDVRAWLEDHGLGQYAEAFASNDVDAEVLRTLTADDLKELGVASLGHRKKLLAAIADLDAAGEAAPGAIASRPARPDIWPSASCARARLSRASASRSRCCSPTSRARSR